MVEQVKGGRSGGAPVGHAPARETPKTDPLDGALRTVGQMVQQLVATPSGAWQRASIAALLAAVRDALAVANDRSRGGDVQVLRVSGARAQMRQMVDALQAPTDINECDEFQELMDALWPAEMRRHSGGFKRGSDLRGSVKTEVKVQLVAEAVRDASKRTSAKMQELQQGATNLGQFSHMTLDQLARLFKRKLRRRKRKVVDAEGNVIDEVEEPPTPEEARELQTLMEIFSQKALDTMRAIREDIAPKWTPEQQPWLIQEADRQVFAIVLATVPKELFEQTEAWQAIQDLRKGQEVFQLRAADKLTEAMGSE